MLLMIKKYDGLRDKYENEDKDLERVNWQDPYRVYAFINDLQRKYTEYIIRDDIYMSTQVLRQIFIQIIPVIDQDQRLLIKVKFGEIYNHIKQADFFKTINPKKVYIEKIYSKEKLNSINELIIDIMQKKNMRLPTKEVEDILTEEEEWKFKKHKG